MTGAILGEVLTDDFKNFASAQARHHAGRTLWFQEVEHGGKKLGRVVGFYYDMAQILVEVAGAPVQYEVDPTLPCFTIVVPRLDSSKSFASIDVFLLDTNSKQRSVRYPHDCPRCQNPALIFFRTVECSNFGCPNYRV